MSPAQEGTPIKKAPDAKKKISGVLVKPCFASFFALLFNILPLASPRHAHAYVSLSLRLTSLKHAHQDRLTGARPSKGELLSRCDSATGAIMATGASMRFHEIPA